MRARRIAHAKNSGQQFCETEPLFRMVNGSSPGDLSKIFNQLVERCRFPERSDGAVYSPYSLRHTLATFSLAEGMTSDRIAEAMGTSVKMLLTHYKHGTIEETRRYLDGKGLLVHSGGLAIQKQASLSIKPPGFISSSNWQARKLALWSDGQRLVIAPTE